MITLDNKQMNVDSPTVMPFAYAKVTPASRLTSYLVVGIILGYDNIEYWSRENMEEYKKIINRIVDFRDARDWKQFHTEENLSKSISIEAGELLEHFQWGDPVDKKELSKELADILIYAFLLAEKLNVDPITIMNDKITENEARFQVKHVKGNSGKKTRADKL